MATSRGRIVSKVAGLAVVAVLCIGAVYWKEIAAQCYLVWLHHDPDYLAEMIHADENAPAFLAVQKHLRSAKGRKQLLLLYLNALHEEIPEYNPSTRYSGVMTRIKDEIRRMQFVETKTAAFILVRDHLLVVYYSKWGSGSFGLGSTQPNSIDLLQAAARYKIV